MVKYYFFTYCYLFFLTYGLSQDVPLNLITYNSANGLPSDYVNKARFDRNGFLWIATNFGVNKFDGTHVTRFTSFANSHNTSISGDAIKAICGDSLVRWVAIEHRGLNCYFDQIDYFLKYFHEPGNTNSLISNEVNCLHLGCDKKLYIGTANGLSIFEKNKSLFTNIADHPLLKMPLDITSLEESKKGNIWIGTNKQGLLNYNKQKGITVAFPIANLLDSNVINDLMYVEKSGEMWMATTGGLWCGVINNNNSVYKLYQPFKELAAGNITCVSLNTDGNIWIGTSARGLYVCETSGRLRHYTKDVINPGGLADNQINDISFNMDKSAWISTPSGVQAYHPVLHNFPYSNTDIHINKKKSAAVPYGLCIWKKYLIAATDKGVWISDTAFSETRSLVLC